MKPEQAPLQPAYPDMQETAGTEEGYGDSEQEAQPESAPSESSAPKESRPKRRRRGGTGRNRRGAAATQSVADTNSAIAPTTEEPEAEVEPAIQHAQAAHAKKQPRGTVVLTIGLPGSGKTSWFRRRAITPLSSDLLRMMLFDDIAEQRYQDLVFSTLRYLLRARMIARMPWNYVDATNLSPRERRGWIKMALEFGYEVHAVFFDVPIEVCMERNAKRGRMVPEDVMQRMAGKLRPPTFDEGFSKITVVRVKKHKASEPIQNIDNVVDDVEEPGGPGIIDENY